MKSKIKENIPFIFFTLLFLIGFGIMLYPVLSNALSQISYHETISSYEQSVSDENSSLYQSMIQEAVNYNEKLTTSSIVDAFSDPEITNSEEYMNILNLNRDGMMGYISIPKIDIKIPIYHGTSSEVLSKGVGHLEGSSFPIGGKSSHAILSAHRGLPSARLFTDLDQLEVGDKFYIYILDQIYTYQVDQVLVIEPSETEALQIQDGKDLVTLVTCTPYGVNTHRLLVRGERVEELAEQVIESESNRDLTINDYILYIGLFGAIVLVLVTIIIVWKIHRKNHSHIETI